MNATNLTIGLGLVRAGGTSDAAGDDSTVPGEDEQFWMITKKYLRCGCTWSVTRRNATWPQPLKNERIA